MDLNALSISGEVSLLVIAATIYFLSSKRAKPQVNRAERAQTRPR